jgi:hypothetical protein
MWSVYGPAIQAAIGTRLSEAEIERLTALLGTFLERAKAHEARSGVAGRCDYSIHHRNEAT